MLTRSALPPKADINSAVQNVCFVPEAAIRPIENWSLCATISGIKWEIFYSLRKAQIVTEQWRKHYNIKRLHSALGY